MNRKQAYRLFAIDILREKQLFDTAFHIEWVSLREKIFDHLYYLGVEYQSSEEAIAKLFQLTKNKLLNENILIIYTVATLLEWDSNFLIDQKEISALDTIIKDIYKTLFDHDAKRR